MTEPIRDDRTARLARKWADNAMLMPVDLDGLAAAAVEYIRTTLPPLNMAEVEWDQTAHHLAGATTTSGHDVVMLELHSSTDIGAYRLDSRDLTFYAGDELTPNGKRYEVREAVEDPHSEALGTVAEFNAAPDGTVVAADGYLSVPMVKQHGKWMRAGDTNPLETDFLVGAPKRVLRWGWGA